MKSCFRSSILEFVFDIYIYIHISIFISWFLTVWAADIIQHIGQILCEQTASDCFIATYGLPMSWNSVQVSFSGGVGGVTPTRQLPPLSTPRSLNRGPMELEQAPEAEVFLWTHTHKRALSWPTVQRCIGWEPWWTASAAGGRLLGPPLTEQHTDRNTDTHWHTDAHWCSESHTDRHADRRGRLREVWIGKRET